MARWIASRIERLLRRFRQDGVRGLAGALRARLSLRNRREYRRKLADAARFDSGGYDTGGILFFDDPAIADASPYDATPSYDFDAVMARLDIDPAGATFIDIGSGKGRILLLAAAHPFAAIVGVEYAEALQAIARANLARHAALAGPDPRIRLETGDAAQLRFPDGPLVLFLFNPFGAATLRAMMANLAATLAAVPRPARLLYVNPQHADVVLAAGFRQIAIAEDHRFAIYASG